MVIAIVRLNITEELETEKLSLEFLATSYGLSLNIKLENKISFEKHVALIILQSG
jgi:hypothetical protein